MRNVKVHAFASTKGGVGKSTLALLAARTISATRVPLLVDLDLTGSSLADALDLEAPELAVDDDGRFDPASAALGWLSSQDTLLRRHWRSRHASKGSPFIQLPYTNDALMARMPISIGEWLWRDPSDGLRILPASSVQGDVQRATRILAEVDGIDWRDSLVVTLRELVEGLPDVTDIVLDLPPGTWGFSHGALAAMLALADDIESNEICWSANPIFVTSPDRNALVPALEYVVANDHWFPSGLRPVVNRTVEAPEFVRRAARTKLVEPLRSLGVEERLVFVNENRGWASLFRGQRREDAGVEAQSLASILRLE